MKQIRECLVEKFRVSFVESPEMRIPTSRQTDFQTRIEIKIK